MTEEIPVRLAGFRAGSLVAGYRLEGQVGAGGMAVVFRARDERLGRPVALKLLSPGLASGSEFRRRFIAESRAAAAVDDPHIIPVYEAGESDGVLFIAMRFVAGGDLRQVLEREGALPPDRAADFISPVASALDAAHSAGLVHRDVKPGNILVDSRPGRPDHVYLSDFGIVKGAVQGSLTRVGSYLGTPDYMAPEQISGQAVDGRADQYSLACVAFQLLTGMVPFKRDTLPAVFYAHVSVPPPPLVSQRPDLPAAVDGVVAKAMAKTAEKRYESCGDFADALREALGLASYRRRSSASAPPSPRPAVTSPDSQPDMTVDSVPGSTPPEAARPGVEPASGPGRLAAAVSAADVSDLLAPGQPGLPDTGPAGAPARRRRLIPRRRRTGPEPAVGPTDSVPDGQPGGPVTPVGAGTAWPMPPLAASIPDAPAVADSQLAEEVEAAAASDEPAGEPDRQPASDLVAPGQPGLPDTGPAGAPARRRGPIPRRPRSPRRRRRSPEPAAGTIAAVPDGQPSGPVTPAEPVPAAVRPDEPDLPEPRSAAAVVEPQPAVLPESASAAALVEAPPAGPAPAKIAPPAGIPPSAARPFEPPTVGTVYPAPGDGLADGGTASLTGPAVAGNGLPAAAATAATDHLPSGTVGTPAVSGDSVGEPDWLTVPGPGAPPGQRPPRRPSPAIVWIRRHRLPVFGLACAILAAAVTLPFISPSQPGSPHASSSSGSPKSSGPSNSAHPSISPTAAATPTFGAALPVQLPADWRSVPITSVAFSPAGDTLAVASARVCLWDIAATHCTSSFGDASVYSVAFSRDGTTLAAGDSSGSIFMWNVLARSQGPTLTDPTGSGVFSVAFSPDGKTLAAGDANGRTYLWNVATGKMIIPLSSPGSKEVTSVAFSPDGTILASASDVHTYLWKVATGKLIGTLTDPGGKVVNSVAFTPDGKILVAGDGNRRTYLWSVATGKLTGTLTAPGSTGVISVTCSPDNTTMAAGDLNGKIYIWNVITRKLITALTDPNNAEINSVQFSANGKALAIGDLSGSAFLWNISLSARVAG